jgi:hypothetical protein
LGAKGVLVLTGYGKEENALNAEEPGRRPSFVAAGLREAVQWILRDLRMP